MSGLPELQHGVPALFDDIARALATTGYMVLPQALPPALVDALFIHFKSLAVNDFRRAGIGKEIEHQVNAFVRSDAIAWLDGSHAATSDYLSWMEALRLGLNQRLFLGLFDFESHYAWYPHGAFYRKHLDAFKGQMNRVISSVLYLNPTWTPADGGELVIYNSDGERELERIAPQYGKLVLFLSEEFPHEVLPVNKPRYSIAGWFRVNNSLAGKIDPPR